VNKTKNNDTLQAHEFKPKDKKDFQKVFNNIYVKNFPATYNEQKLREIFGQYGEISSLFMVKNETGIFAFVCFSKTGSDRGYGYDCANKAVKDLHGKKIDDSHTWYVKPALSK
jgi:RNA recognition motif-containing protein